MKRYIAAQARTRNEVVDKLEEQTLNLLQHLAYLYVFGKVQDYNHWHNEVWKFFHSMSKIRIGKKVRYLTNLEFLDATYHQYNSNDVFRYVLTSAPELKTEYTPDTKKINNIEGFKSICDAYFNWLAETICKSGRVFALDVYKKLEELGL